MVGLFAQNIGSANLIVAWVQNQMYLSVRGAKLQSNVLVSNIAAKAVSCHSVTITPARRPYVHVMEAAPGMCVISVGLCIKCPNLSKGPTDSFVMSARFREIFVFNSEIMRIVIVEGRRILEPYDIQFS